jgi:hypothetical protein
LNFNQLNLCEGDSVRLNLTSPFQRYRWNTQDTSSSIVVDSSGTYFAQVWNNGCRDRSDSLLLTLNPLPQKPTILLNNDTLFTNGQGQLQWYFNQIAIPSANGNKFAVSQAGRYYVSTTDSNSCRNYSDTLLVNLVGLKERPSNTYSIFPNPFNERIFIRSSDQIKEVRLKTLNGQIATLMTVDESIQPIEIDLSGIKNGIYVLELVGEDSLIREIMIKQP